MIGWVYRNILKKIYFRMDPEKVHDRMTALGTFLGRYAVTRKLVSVMFNYQNPMLEQEMLGIKFKNPIGLAAGFDKNALLTYILPDVGFGFAEVGSITGEPCEGNPRPRLWRLVKSQSLVVYYGLKNEGCEIISERLRGKRFRIPIGISIAKTNCAAAADANGAVKDYAKAYKAFSDIGSYTTINISCPNTYGGEPFTDAVRLDLLLNEINKLPKKKPIFLKMPSDLEKEEVDKLLEVAAKHKVDGLICTNLAKGRNHAKIVDRNVPEKGGISGKVVQDLSDELISYTYRKTKGKFIIIGCGGVFTDEDAYRKIKLGASLIQMITGMIFQGPQVIGEINKGLVKLLRQDGYKNIKEAVGKGVC